MENSAEVTQLRNDCFAPSQSSRLPFNSYCLFLYKILWGLFFYQEIFIENSWDLQNEVDNPCFHLFMYCQKHHSLEKYEQGLY